MEDKRALVIGINYLGTKDQLDGCISDALRLYDILTKKLDYPRDNVLLITDHTESKPTRTNIVKAFQWLLSSAPAASFGKQDLAPQVKKTLMFFSYSGHTKQVVDPDGDEADGFDEGLAPLDYLSSGFVLDDQIRRDLVSKVRAGSSLSGLMDICHSGSLFDLPWTMVASGPTMVLAKDGQYKDCEGLVVLLSGSKDFQTSSDTHDKRGIPSGVLTNAVTEIFQTSGYHLPCDVLLTKVQAIVTASYAQMPCMSFGHFMPVSTTFPI